MVVTYLQNLCLVVEKWKESQHPTEHTNQSQGSTMHFQPPCEWKFDEVCVHNLISSMFTVLCFAKVLRFQGLFFFGFVAIVKLVSNESLTAVYILFADVHLNLEKPGKDWSMGNKWLIAENYSYQLLSWMTINKVFTQIIEKNPRLLKIEFFWAKNVPIGQFSVAMRNNELAICRLSNQSFSLIQLLQTELVQENVLWSFTAIISTRWFFSLVFP